MLRKLTQARHRALMSRLPSDLQAGVTRIERAMHDAYNWANIQLHAGSIDAKQYAEFEALLENAQRKSKH